MRRLERGARHVKIRRIAYSVHRVGRVATSIILKVYFYIEYFPSVGKYRPSKVHLYDINLPGTVVQ